MGLFDFLGGIVKPITDLIDDLTTTDEEKGAIKAKLEELENQIAGKLLEYEAKLVESQASIVKAEATGASWLQKNWRPVLMLTIVAIVGNNYLIAPYVNSIFGPGAAPILDLPEHLWSLMNIGVGGYVLGRSAEKIVPSLIAGRKK